MRLTAVTVALALLAAGCGGDGGAEETATTGGETTAERPALDPSKRHQVIFETNHGSFTVTLDVETSPKTSASIAALARRGFFDGTICHRIVPGFVIQCGDPTGTGTGGPGYSTRDPVPPGTKYVKGVVAMAKTAAEPAGTAGSQFFVVTGADIGLPAEYGLLGKVTDGLDVVDKIGKLGDPATEEPTERVEIERATVTAN